MQTHKLLMATTALCCSLTLTGCTTPGANTIPRGGAMTMTDIYRSETSGGETPQKVSSDDLSQIRSTLVSDKGQTNYVGYTATAINETNNLFHKLPNPEIAVYVFPHMVSLNGEYFPKPGLSTGFFLYKQNHYAMPNEEY